MKINIIIIVVTVFSIYSCEESISELKLSEMIYDHEIVFNSNRGGNDEIYLIKEDGTNLIRLTNNLVQDWFPKWSPDGEKIAYFSKYDGTKQLFVMNKDGSNQKQISFGLNIDVVSFRWEHEWIEWSRDGSKIFIQTIADQQDPNLSNRQREIYMINSDGSNQTFLAIGESPNWVDGKIIYGGSESNRIPISSINIDGSDPIQIAVSPVIDFSPVVSPDYNKIIFHSYRHNNSGNSSLHIMNIDGSNINEIGAFIHSMVTPTFSPSSEEILYVASSPGSTYRENAIIYKIDINGNNKEIIYNIDGFVNSTPSYSPNGEKIIFSAYKDDKASNIYLKDLLSRKDTELTDDEESNLTNNNPDWNPSK